MSEPSDEILDAEVVSDSTVPAPVLPDADYNEAGVPSFDYVRNRIEGKFATSAGATELAEESPQGVSIDEQLAERERAGRDKLEEIRRSMRGE
jgi:phage shock protein A